MVFVELSGLTTNQAQSARMHKKGNQCGKPVYLLEQRCLFRSVVSLMFHNGLLFKKLKIELY